MSLRMTDEEYAAFERRRAAHGDRPAKSAAVTPAPRAPKRQPKKGPSELELAFAKQLSDARFPAPQREFKFMANRDFRLDYAWPERKLAVEVQGMVHRIRERFLRDVEKLAMAQIHGWTVLLVAGQDVRSGRGMGWLVTLWESRKC